MINFNKKIILFFFSTHPFYVFAGDSSNPESPRDKFTKEVCLELKGYHKVDAADQERDVFCDTRAFLGGDLISNVEKRQLKKYRVHPCIDVSESPFSARNKMLLEMSLSNMPKDKIIRSYARNLNDIGDLSFSLVSYRNKVRFFQRENYFVSMNAYASPIIPSPQIPKDDGRVETIGLARAIDRLIQFDLMHGRSRRFAMEAYAKKAGIKDPKKDQFKFTSKPFLLKQDIAGVGKRGELVWDVRVYENSDKAPLLAGSWVHFKTLKEAAWVHELPKEDWLKAQDCIDVEKTEIDPAWLPSAQVKAAPQPPKP